MKLITQNKDTHAIEVTDLTGKYKEWLAAKKDNSASKGDFVAEYFQSIGNHNSKEKAVIILDKTVRVSPDRNIITNASVKPVPAEITEIQRRLIASIGPEDSDNFYKAMGLAIFNEAGNEDTADAYRLALWFEKAPAEVKQEFLETFNEENNNLRICSNCGKFMCKGYYLETRYACSDECAIALYDGNERQLREDIKRSVDDEDGDCFWTEW